MSDFSNKNVSVINWGGGGGGGGAINQGVQLEKLQWFGGS